MSKLILFVGFFSLFSNVILCGKPVIDFQDSYVWGFYVSSCERPEFTAKFSGKNSFIVVLTEANIYEVEEKRRQGYEKVIAYLFEPRVFSSKIYEYIEKSIDQFDLILTFDKYFLSRYPNKCKFVHAVAPCFINDQKIHEKTRLCSMICGCTNDSTDGHRFRKSAFLKHKHYFDAYKTDETPRTLWKDEWINDFCFSVIIESTKIDYYFTEKILDCFRAGTIPIYWGCPAIGSFFDKEGIIAFESLKDLSRILESLSFEEYKRRLSAVERNFKISERYPSITSRENSDKPCTIDAVWPHIKGYFEG